MVKSKPIIGGVLLLLVALIVGYFYMTMETPDIEIAVSEEEEDDTSLDDIQPLLDMDRDYTDDIPSTPEDSSVLPMSSANTEMTRMWNSKGADTKDVSFWRPTNVPGYSSVGDMISLDKKELEPNQTVFYVNNDPKFSALPTSYEKVWQTDDVIDADEDMTIWEPVCPNDYVPMGHVIGEKKGLPARDAVRCPHKDLVHMIDDGASKIWNSKKGHGKKSEMDPVRVYRVFGTNTITSHASVDEEPDELGPLYEFNMSE